MAVGAILLLATGCASHRALGDEIGRPLGTVENENPRVAFATLEVKVPGEKAVRTSPDVVPRPPRIIVAICGTADSVGGSRQVTVGWIRQTHSTPAILTAAKAGKYTSLIPCDGMHHRG